MELKNTAYEVEQRVATIWLDRPHRMNAWTGRLHTEYRYLLQQANDDAEVGAIVVTGRGRGFCVGGDSEALALLALRSRSRIIETEGSTGNIATE